MSDKYHSVTRIRFGAATLPSPGSDDVTGCAQGHSVVMSGVGINTLRSVNKAEGWGYVIGPFG